MRRQATLSLLMEELVKDKPDRARVQDCARKLGIDPNIDLVRMMATVLEQASQLRSSPRGTKEPTEKTP